MLIAKLVLCELKHQPNTQWLNNMAPLQVPNRGALTAKQKGKYSHHGSRGLNQSLYTAFALDVKK